MGDLITVAILYIKEPDDVGRDELSVLVTKDKSGRNGKFCKICSNKLKWFVRSESFI